MGFLSDSDNNAKITITTVADGDGVQQTNDNLDKLGDKANESDGKMSDFSKNFSDGMDKVAKFSAVAGAGVTLFAAGSVSKLTEVVKSSKALSTQTGMSITDASRLQAAFERMGLASDASSTSIRTFSKQIAAAQQDTKDMSNQINAWGISVKNADGTARNFNDILYDVADKFHSMPDGAQKTAEAMQLFGRSGTQMIKVLNGGKDAIVDLEKEADKLGLTLNSSNIDAVQNYIKSNKDLADTTQSLQIQVGTLTAPILTQFNTKLNDVLQSLIGANAPTRDLTASFLAFSGPVFGAIAAIAEFGSNAAGTIEMVKDLHGAVSMPMVMGSIAVAGALADIGLVIKAVMTAHDAIQAMDDAAKAQQAQENVNADLKVAAAKAAAAGNYGKAAQYNKIAMTNNTKAPTTSDYIGAAVGAIFNPSDWAKAFGFATGGYTGIGGANDIAGIVHKGEYVLRQDQVDQRTGRPKSLSSSDSGNVHYHSYDIRNVNLNTGDAVRAFFQVRDRDAQAIQMGLSPGMGA